MVLVLPPPENWALKDDSHERLGKGSLLSCHGHWLTDHPGALGGYREVLLQRLRHY